MSGNFQKTPLTSSLNQFAGGKAQDAIQALGKALPCSVVSVSGAIITVKFEVQSRFTLPNVTVPLFGPEYIRYPIQPGDKGVVFAADAYLGGMSGLGGGVADLTPRNNLTTLVFFPIGNKNWFPVDPNAVVLYGPNGTVLRDTQNQSNVTLLPASIALSAAEGGSTITMTGSSITLACGGHSIVINATGVVIDGRVFLGHEHTGVQPGAGNTGGVV